MKVFSRLKRSSRSSKRSGGDVTPTSRTPETNAENESRNDAIVAAFHLKNAQMMQRVVDIHTRYTADHNNVSNEDIEFLHRVAEPFTVPVVATGTVHALLREILNDEFEREHDLDVLDRAVDHGRKAMTGHPGEDEASHLNRLCYLLSSKYIVTGYVPILNEAVAYGLQSEAKISPRSDRFSIWNDLGYCLSARYQCLYNISDLDESIRVSRLAVNEAKIRGSGATAHLANLSARLHMRSVAEHKPDDDQEALGLLTETLSRLSHNDPERAAVMANLSIVASKAFDRSGYWKDIDEPIRLMKIALGRTDHAESDRAGLQQTLASLLYTRYEVSTDMDDLDESLLYSAEAVKAKEARAERKSAFWLTFVHNLVRKFDATKSMIDLETALERIGEALWIFPDHSSGLVKLLHSAGYLSAHKFLRSNRLDDMIHLISTAISLNSHQLGAFSNIPDELGEVRSVGTKLLAYFSELVSLAPSSPSEEHALVQWHQLMQREYRKLFKKDFLIALEEMMGLSINLELLFEINALSPDYNSDLLQGHLVGAATYGLTLPGIATTNYRLRILDIKIRNDTGAEIISNMADIDRKLREYSITPEDNGSQTEPRAYKLVELSQTCSRLFQMTSDSVFLDKAFEIGDLALLNINKSHDGGYQLSVPTRSWATEKDDAKAYAFANMATLLRTRYMSSVSRRDTDEACRYAQLAVATSPETNASYQLVCAVTLKARYRFSGKVTDLDEAVTMLRAAEAATINDVQQKVTMQNELGLILRLRFHGTGDSQSLDEAISRLEIAQSISTDQMLSSGQIFNNLALCLQSRYCSRYQQEDLDRSVAYLEKALQSTKPKSEFRCGLLANLANAYGELFEVSQSNDDIFKAESYAAEAFEHVPVGHPTRIGLLTDYTRILQQKYIGTGEENDFELAIRAAEEALSIIPPDHIQYQKALRNLSSLLEDQIPVDATENTLERCIVLQRKAFRSTSSNPMQQIYAGRDLARLLSRRQDDQQCHDVLVQLVDLMAELDIVRLDRKDRQDRLQALAQIPSDIVASCLRTGVTAERTLEYMERSRGLTIGFMLENRAAVQGADTADHKTVKDYNLARLAVDSLAKQMLKPGLSVEERSQLSQQHQGHIRRLDDLSKELKSMPGFAESFLPISGKEIRYAAQNRVIVVVNSSAQLRRSDAIVVQSSGIQSVNLPNLVYGDILAHIRTLVKDIFRGPPRSFAERNWKFCQILSWIWSTITQPVLSLLDKDRTRSDRRLPHVTWIGIGILGWLPFHAAGEYAGTNTDCNMMTIAHSSYAPSIRALLHAQKQKPQIYMRNRKEARLLLVSMKDPSLPGVDAEVHSIVTAAKEVEITRQENVKPKEVMDQMLLHSLVHFACHGVSDAIDPGESHLIVAPGPSDQPDYRSKSTLSVRQIAAKPAVAPDLAFLSACSTAQSQATNLADEAIHIASAFQLAGFRHVIGTLWVTKDYICQEVAGDFYRELFKSDNDDTDDWKVAESLHYAVSQARGKAPESPLLWASFVHLGP